MDEMEVSFEDAFGVLIMVGLAFGVWALAFRDEHKRWPRGWEWLPH